MPFKLHFTEETKSQYVELQNNPSLTKRFKAVRKALHFLSLNPRHPGLRAHKVLSLNGANGEEVFEAYAGNHTPGAYRIFWYYGPKMHEITIMLIVPHP